VTAFYAWIGDLAQRGILPSDFQYPFLIRGFLCVLVLAPILGGLSHLVVTRRMAFFSAALGQAALTGVAIGLLLGEPLNAPYGGMFGFCLLATLGMVYAKRRSSLPPDTLTVGSDDLNINEDPLAARSAVENSSALGGVGKMGPIQLRALGSVQLEGSSPTQGTFAASAASAAYDQLKEMFVLEGTDRQPAESVRRPAAPVLAHALRTVEATPRVAVASPVNPMSRLLGTLPIPRFLQRTP
jgi:hypothetical protein